MRCLHLMPGPRTKTGECLQNKGPPKQDLNWPRPSTEVSLEFDINNVTIGDTGQKDK